MLETVSSTRTVAMLTSLLSSPQKNPQHNKVNSVHSAVEQFLEERKVLVRAVKEAQALSFMAEQEANGEWEGADPDAAYLQHRADTSTDPSLQDVLLG